MSLLSPPPLSPADFTGLGTPTEQVGAARQTATAGGLKRATIGVTAGAANCRQGTGCDPSPASPKKDELDADEFGKVHQRARTAESGDRGPPASPENALPTRNRTTERRPRPRLSANPSQPLPGSNRETP
ncbi:hypothetical protein GCM10010172_46480 [Paractinoplanes ferrugineus]|uniref:Uncharacterized protein n=1 Tax=Paractinoplanes ferrugineus TaxID=113564 RepID=A0A919MHH3_9ACTN|nr:hypothetical protein Afe05nite_76680 [Actinoplanes ferrugineus]